MLALLKFVCVVLIGAACVQAHAVEPMQPMATSSHMSGGMDQLGQGVKSMIKSKTDMLHSTAQAGMQSMSQLGGMMQKGMKSMGQHGGKGMMMPMEMMNSAQDFMSKSGSQLKEQVKQHLTGTLGRLGSMQGMGQKMGKQAEGIGRTLTNGLQGAVSQLTQTGQQVSSQLQQSFKQNTQAMTGILGSLQGSMGSMGGNMQKNMDGLMQHAQKTAQQLTSSLTQVVQGPLNMLSSLTSGLGNMMMKGGGHGGGGGGGGYGGGGGGGQKKGGY